MSCFRLFGAITFLLLALSPGWAQHFPTPGTTNPAQSAEQERDPDLQHKLQMQRQKKRVEDMQRDSQKLLELATELKHYVDKSGEHILSIEVLHKAEEMEKLAHQIKINMRGE